MATGLALLASLLWGTADFFGGTASRRLPATAVVFVSQAIALPVLVVIAVVATSYDDPAGYLPWAISGAVVGLIALVAFYAALADGTMGVVAPIAALGVVVPVLVGVVQGDRPSGWQLGGIVAAVAGVVLASGPELRPRDGAGHYRGHPLVLAVVAAAGFGTVIVCVTHGARSSTVMTLTTMRATTVLLLGVGAAVGRVRTPIVRRYLPVLALIGGGDVGANGALAVASTHGLLSVVAVLSSLYPAVTVLLARVVHDERLQRQQSVGVVAALTGVVLIAAGGGASG